MPKSEEPTRQFLKLDLWAIRRRTFSVVLISLPVFAAYCGVLLLLFPASGTPEGAVVLIVVEGAVGLAATRKYSGLGAGTRSRLGFVDPSILGSGWKEVTADMHREEISRLFERTYAEIDEHESSRADDLNDVAWFAVLAYSVTSMGIAVATGPKMYLVLGAAGLLLVLCGVCYVAGYRNYRIRLLEEDVDQLQHHVMARLSALEIIITKGRSCVQWLEKEKLRVLSDVGFVVESPNTTVSYWFGIPSQQSERFEIIGPHELSPGLLARLRNAPIMTQSGWQLSTRQQESNLMIQIFNPVKLVRFHPDCSVVLNPTFSSAASAVLVESMSMLVGLFVI
ncbi:MAG: hypothetical protein C4K47_09975 [Candidatus Thorarchaeota archaeon]|nr:MAG: hypothetical protein C4K47_09975 [Candidatus Thorarchaeota archaeon]